jgi:hypothetical protein
MPEFGDCDGSPLKQVIGAAGQPGVKIKPPPLAPNDDIRVQDYGHLSAGILTAFFAVRSSRKGGSLLGTADLQLQPCSRIAAGRNPDSVRNLP